MKKYQKAICSFLIIFSFIVPRLLGAGFIYETGQGKTEEKSNDDSYISDESSISTVAPVPEFSFESESQVLMEAGSGKIIYANNEEERLLPASVTKVMTLLLTMEQIDSGKLKYDDKVVCSANASSMGGSQIWFKEGEELSVDEALKCICVVSANDVTVAVAEKIGGSETNFVAMMNKKAEELGMTNTHFMNSHGIDEEGHYTSAKDIAIMSRELITKHPDILKYTSIWMDSIRDGTFELSSTNKLIRYYEGANGLKTGSTSQALFNLSGTATRDGTTFIAVVMRAPSSDVRLAEIKQLLDYGFATYESKVLAESGKVVQSKTVNKNVSTPVDIVLENDIGCVVEKGTQLDTSENVTYNKEFSAPMKKGEVVGKLEMINNLDGSVLGESNLVLSSDVEKSSFKDYLVKVFSIYVIKE